MVKLYEKLKKIKQNKFKNIQTPTHSTLYLSDNNIELEINGIPSSIILTFTGTGNFIKKLPIDIKAKVSKRNILISNTFLKEMPKLIFRYLGDIKIYDCQIMNFDGTKIRAEIKNNQIEGIFNQSKTKMEDDTLRLIEDSKPIDRRTGRTGLISPIFNASKADIYGKFQKYGKKDIDKISSVIKQFATIKSEYNPVLQQSQDSPIMQIEDLQNIPTNIQTTSTDLIQTQDTITSIESSVDAVEFQEIKRTNYREEE
jgi:hypothetical protein